VNLVRSRSWGQIKPRPGSKVDWGHPLAEGLTFATLFNEDGGRTLDLVSETLSTTSTSVVRPGGRYTAGGGERWSAPNSNTGLWGRVTRGWSMATGVTRRGALSNFTGYMVTHDTAATVAPYGIMNWNSTTRLSCVINTGPVESGILPPALDVPTIIMAGQNEAANFAFVERYDNWKGSPSQKEVLGGSGAGVITQTRDRLIVGSDASNTLNFPGVVHFAYAWNRELDESERALLAVEPYAFIAPPAPRFIYIGFGPVAGGVAAALTGTGAVASAGRAGVQREATLTGRGDNASDTRAGLLRLAAFDGHGDNATNIPNIGLLRGAAFDGHGDAATSGTGQIVRLAVFGGTGAGSVVGVGTATVAGEVVPDPIPATFTFREHGHIYQINDVGHTVTLRERASFTVREMR
jgi:hypothetical protein